MINLSYQNKLSHISSCLNCVNLIDRIYARKEPTDPFVLGAGHAGLALYVVLEKYGFCDAEEMIKKHGVHPSRDMEHGIWCSSGSLGQAETVACGLALADRNRQVFLVSTDGGCMEGSVYEAVRFMHRHLDNLKMWIVYNRLGAYGEIAESDLPTGVRIHPVDQERYPEFLRGLAGHYVVMSDLQYVTLMSAHTDQKTGKPK